MNILLLCQNNLTNEVYRAPPMGGEYKQHWHNQNRMRQIQFFFVVLSDHTAHIPFIVYLYFHMCIVCACVLSTRCTFKFLIGFVQQFYINLTNIRTTLSPCHHHRHYFQRKITMQQQIHSRCELRNPILCHVSCRINTDTHCGYDLTIGQFTVYKSMSSIVAMQQIVKRTVPIVPYPCTYEHLNSILSVWSPPPFNCSMSYTHIRWS